MMTKTQSKITTNFFHTISLTLNTLLFFSYVCDWLWFAVFFFFFVLHTFCLCLFVWTKLIKMTKKQTGNKAIYSILSEDLITNFSLSYFCFVLFGPKNSQYLRERLLVFRRQINPGFLTFELCGYKNILIDSVEDETEYCIRHKKYMNPKVPRF